MAWFSLAVGPTVYITPAGGDGSTPTESGSVHGTGFSQKVICAFDECPSMWIEDETQTICIGAVIGDRAGIAQVIFYLNGNSVTVRGQTVNPRTGSRGFCITPKTGGGTDGDYTLYAIVQPVNGYERLLSLPLTLNSNGTISRALRYVDYTNGSDSNAGTSQGASWKSFWKAANTAPSGAIIYYATGQTYLEDSNSGSPQTVARMQDFRPLVAGGTATISKTTAGNLQIKSTKACFEGITFDASGAQSLQGGANGVLATKRCAFIDPNGATGPTYAYPSAACPFTFVLTTGCFNAVLECNVVSGQFTGWGMIRNTTALLAHDAMTIEANSITDQSGMRSFNYSASQPSLFKLRQSSLANPVVSSVSYNSGTGKSTITWSGSPGLSNATESAVLFVTGALAGQTFTMVGSGGGGGSSSSTTIVTGDCSAASSGDTAFIYANAHADAMQFKTDASTSANVENIYHQRYKAVGVNYQLVLAQRGQTSLSGTISTTGTAVTFSTAQTLKANDFIVLNSGSQKYQARRVSADTSASTSATLVSAFTADQSGQSCYQAKTMKDVGIVSSIIAYTGVGSEIGQIQHGACHWVYDQCDLLGAAFEFRNDSTLTSQIGAIGLEDFTMFDCITHQLTSAATYPTTGININNCHNEVAGAASGNPGSDGAVTFDSQYRPTAGLSKTISGNPVFPWSYEGTPIRSGALIGAQTA